MRKNVIVISIMILSIVLLVGLASCMKAEEKKVVLYVSSMALKEFSASAGKDSMGMDMVPVNYLDKRADKGKVIVFYSFKLASDNLSAELTPSFVGQTEEVAKKEILFYGNPMSPKDFSKEMKKDDMGMNYAPVYKD
jgi:hypothetical protein